MSAHKKLFMVLDTETRSGDTVFDLGFKVMDRQGHVYESASYAIAETFTDADGCAGLMGDRFSGGSKAAAYFAGVIATLCGHRDSFTVVPFADARQAVLDTLERYGATLCAYNVSFDLRALDKTSKRYLGCEFFPEKPEILDIWAAAMSCICNTAGYVDFVNEHQRVTDGGNPKTNAETVYQFMTGNTEFEEAHTALADCEIECEILQKCVKTHKRMRRAPVGACASNPDWKAIARRYREKQAA